MFHCLRWGYFSACLCSLVSSLMVGYGMASKGPQLVTYAWLAFVMAVSVYIILDIEYPRLGFIRVDSFDQALMDLRASIK